MFCKNGDERKSLTKVQRRQFIDKMLNEDFPLVFILITIVLNVILSIAAIGFQVASIVFETNYYYIYCGIWVGAFVFLTEIITITLGI